MKTKFYILFLLAILVSTTLNAQLNGVYTINPSLPASTTNYKTFTAAIFDLTSLSGTRPDSGTRVGPGISGPVTFQVASGTYTEQVSLDSVIGASATNRITFTSAAGFASAVVLQFTSTSSAANYTFRLFGADYVTLQRMTLMGNASSFPIVVSVANNGTNHALHNIIQYCRIKSSWSVNTPSAAITSTGNNTGLKIVGDTFSNATCGINFSGNNSLGNYTDSVVIDSNYMANGTLTGLGGSDCFYGIVIQYAKNLKFRNNYITKNGCCADKMGNIFNISNNSEIYNNQFYMSGGVGCVEFQNLNPNLETDTIKIYNNFMRYGGNSNGYIVRFQSCRNVWFVNNNLYHNGTNTGIRAIETFGSSANHINLAIANNIIYGGMGTLVNVSGSTLAFSKSAISVLDNNVYNRSTPSQNIVAVFGTGYTNMTSIMDKVYTGSDQGSLNTTVSFVGLNDLHITTTSCLLGRNIGFVNRDIDGATRTFPLTIGADEVSASRPNNEALAEMIILPGTTFTPGLQDIKVRIRNNGGNTISSLNISYSVNGGTPVTQTLPSPLNSCDTATITFTGANQYNFAAGPNQLKIYTSSPNGGNDAVPSNDTLSQTFCSPLNGTYTVDGSIAASSTNFQDFSQLASALGSCGVNGPVTINVAAGTYNTQTIIYAIPGNSAVNTVTIDGGTGNAASRIVLGTGLTSSNPHVLRIEGVVDLTIRNLTFRSTDVANGYLIQAFSGTTLRVKQCNFEFTGAAATSTSSNLVGIVSNSGGTYGSSNSTLANFEIDSNTFLNGTYAMHHYMNSAANVLWIRKNIITNIYTTGIYGAIGLFKILDNSITLRNSSSQNGIHLFASSPGFVTQLNQVNGNIIKNSASNGIFLQSANGGGSTALGEVYNNMIGGNFFGSTVNGIQISTGTRWKIYNNSILISSNGSTLKGLNINGSGSNNRIRNNIFSITSTSASTVYPVEINPSSMVDSMDFNAFYNTIGTTLIRINTTNYTSGTYLAAYPSGAGVNSKNGNPDFYSNSDLHSFGGLLNGAGTNVFLSTDIDGESRGATPDIGADEYTPVTSDGSIFSINNILPCPLTNDSVFVSVRNYGVDSLSSIRIYTSLDGGSPDSIDVTLTPKLAQGQTKANVFAGIINTSAGTHQLKCWVDYPNGVTDMNRLNDTSTITFGTKLSGTYTVGGASPDFSDLFTAFSALNTRGVCGSVTINLRNGTYSGPFTLDSIPGSSASNPVLIQSESGNANSVIWDNPTSGSSLNNFTLNIFRSDFVTFQNMTIQRSGSDLGYTRVVDLTGHTYNIRFIGTKINAPVTTLTSTNKVLINHQTSGGTHRLINFTLAQSELKGGSYHVYFAGNTLITEFSDSIYQNSFDSVYNTAIYRTQASNLYIYKNLIQKFASNALNVNGIYLDNCKDSTVISSNKIIIAGVGFGIYLNVQNGNSQQTVVINNMISMGQTVITGSVNGIYLTNPNRVFVAYNSVRMMISSGAMGYGLYAYSNGSFINNTLINNNLTSDISGTSIFGAYVGGTTLANSKNIFSLSNYNNYNCGGNVRCQVFTTIYTTLATYRGNLYTSPFKNDSNSISAVPNYYGVDDLRILGASLDSMGTPLANYTLDIDGVTRNTVKTDIGCYEYAPTANDVGVSAITSPTNPLTLGSQNVVVTLRNYGLVTLTSANVEYKINDSIKTIAWTGSLAPGGSTTVTFTGSNQYNFTGSTQIKAYAYSPNGNTDTININDTATVSVCPGISGVYTIDGSLPTSGSNFNTLQEAMNQLACGVTGPVTFNIAAGTFNGRILCSSVPGASSVNTITFNGGTGNAGSRIIEFNSSTALEPYIVRIANTPYVSIRNVSIRSNNTTNAWLVHINNSNNCAIKNCNIEFTGSALTSNGSNLAGLVINGSNTTMTTGGTSTNAEIDSNFFNGGYYSIYTSMGASTQVNYFRRDSMINAYSAGAYFNANQTVKFIRNYVSPRTSFAGNDGIVLFNGNSGGSNFHEIKENVIVNAGFRGIYMATSSGGATTKGQMYNNFIGGGFRNTSGVYGIQTTSGNWNYYHNTVNVDIALSGGNVGRALIQTTSSGNNMVNNIFALTANSTATDVIPVETSSSSFFTTVDNNVYYNRANTNRIKIASTTYTSSTFNVAYPSGGGVNSLDLNPAFISSTNLHIADTNIEMSNRGTNLSISTDIDGASRLTTPDIGADEYVPSLRSATGSYTVGSGCPVISGNTWHYLKDNNGNVIMAINPNGNNLGATCWGFHLNPASGIRSDSTTIATPSNQSKFSYIFDRNFYIIPTTQPSSPVSVRFYCTGAELQEVVDSVFNKYAQTISFDSVNITKYNGTNVNLSMGDNAADSTYYTVLNAVAIQQDGPLYYMQVSTPSFSEFVPSFTPESPNSPLPIHDVSVMANVQGKDVLVSWIPQSELKTPEYIIERQTGQSAAVEIGRVENTGAFRYSFMDAGAAGLNADRILYRIGWSSAQGVEYSAWAPVFISGSVQLYPNPAYDQITLKGQWDDGALYRIFDVQGKKVQEGALQGNQELQIGLRELPSGLYFLMMEQSGKTQTFRFEHQR